MDIDTTSSTHIANLVAADDAFDDNSVANDSVANDSVANDSVANDSVANDSAANYSAYYARDDDTNENTSLL